MGPVTAFLLDRVAWLVPLLLSLSVHEWAHAAAASALGDDTAERQGRLTMDPLAHVDPVGTLLLPLMGVPFGWAKPVPVEPNNFSGRVSLRMGMLWTALAGPLSNLVLGLICGLGYGLLARDGHVGATAEFLYTMALLNFMLALFNLLPVPPLDGSRIVDGLCPDRLRPAWERLQQLGPLLLVAVIAVPFLVGFSVFDGALEHAQRLLYWLAGGS